MEAHYLSEPTIINKPIWFQKFTFGERQHHLEQYQHYSHTWVMASCMGDETDESPITPDGEIPTAFEGDVWIAVAAIDWTNAHGDDLHVPPDDESIAKPVEYSDNTGETVENSGLSILSVKSRDYSKVALAKEEVMPTWAAESPDSNTSSSQDELRSACSFCWKHHFKILFRSIQFWDWPRIYQLWFLAQRGVPS